MKGKEYDRQRQMNDSQGARGDHGSKNRKKQSCASLAVSDKVLLPVINTSLVTLPDVGLSGVEGESLTEIGPTRNS
jgi:hypothetical protein